MHKRWPTHFLLAAYMVLTLAGAAPAGAAPAAPRLPTATAVPPPRASEPEAAAIPAGNTAIRSFQAAKRHLTILYADHAQTLYSGCAFDLDRQVDTADCGYRQQREGRRAHSLEWEHVVPAEAFGRGFAAWQVGHPDCIDRRGRLFRGRQCAAKVDLTFRRIEADMYNLYPEIGELNNLRANIPMGRVEVSRYDFGTAGVRLGEGHFQPRQEVLGDVARTYLYMDAAYPMLQLLNGSDRALYQLWSAADPVDAWECERARRIERVQGNRNLLVATPCSRAGLNALRVTTVEDAPLAAE